MKDTILYEIIPAVILTALFAWAIVSLIEIDLHTGIHNWNMIKVFLEFAR